MQIQTKAIDDLKPYAQNPRKISEAAVDAVAASIKRYGWKVPVVISANGTLVTGHTRLAAARKLGLAEIPCIVADDLTPEMLREFRLVDNRTNELTGWDLGLLATELEELAVDMSELGFSEDELWQRRQAWRKLEKRCNLKYRPKIRRLAEISAVSFFESNGRGEGVKLEELKVPENVKLFADTVADYVQRALGEDLKCGDWCIMTTPRRRHKQWHFATEVCKAAAGILGIAFHADAVTAKDRSRLEPEFHLEKNPREANVLLVDDVCTTGMTLTATRQLLAEAGHAAIFCIAGVKNG